MMLRLTLASLILVECASGSNAIAKESKAPDPARWCFAAQAPLEVLAKPGDKRKPLLTLGPGALIAGFDSKNSRDHTWIRVMAIDPGKVEPVAGWVDSARVQVLPLGQFPLDKEILKLAGGVFLEDFAAANAAIARYLLRAPDREPALLCYLGSAVLPQTRLQLFTRRQGKLTAGAYIELPFSEMHTAITRLEIRDLLGDGNDCLITHEPYRVGPQNSGVNVVIRRLEGGAFKTLGQIPLEARNLAAYPPKLQILEPTELNIGRPGTDTKGAVEFGARGALTDIVWKGKVNFHVLGREEPVETLSLEMTWSWDGTRFSPRR